MPPRCRCGGRLCADTSFIYSDLVLAPLTFDFQDDSTYSCEKLTIGVQKSIFSSHSSVKATSRISDDTMAALLEVTLSWLLKNARGRDQKSFYRSAAFADLPEPTVDITSPECGPGPRAAPAQLGREHSHDGAGRVPSLEWREPAPLEGRVREWLLVCEDPDAPLPTPIPHG